MKITLLNYQRNRMAFTLIELLVVIAVIGVLAGMVVMIGPGVMNTAKISRCQTELKTVALAINNYKAKKGFYPPDNPNNPALPPLFYELAGTIVKPDNSNPNNSTFTTVQGNYSLNAAAIMGAFGIGGFVNSTQDRAENPVFSVNFSMGQFAANSANALVLVCPVDGPNMVAGFGGKRLNTWHYVSGSPTNNVGSFDLWADIIVGGKTNRICNWSTSPIPL
jgi:prepilin-type N-terminal cleavage/methylation domain-containing protein